MARSPGDRKRNDTQRRAHAIAAKKIIVRHLNEAMIERQKTKHALAQELRTSRSQLARLLDPDNVAVSLETIARAAAALGKRIIVLLEDADCRSELVSRTPKKAIANLSSQMATSSETKKVVS
jgi:antitoxin HicB